MNIQKKKKIVFKQQVISEEEQPVKLKIQPAIQDKVTITYKNLTVLPEIYLKNHIKHLHLSHNKLITIKGIQLFPELESLNLSYNCLSEIRELELIICKEKLIRLALRENLFEYGYEKIAATMFIKLQKLDDLAIPDRSKMQILSESISKHFVKAYSNAEQILNFMNDLLKKINIKKELLPQKNDTQGVDLGNDGLRFLDLLYENISEQNMIVLNNVYAKFNKEIQKMSILKNLQLQQNIIKIWLQSGFKCTCRPMNVRIDNHDTFVKIFDRILLHFGSRYNKKLEGFLDKKIRSNTNLDQQSIDNKFEYRRECLIFEFYRLKPNQANLNEHPGKYIEKINPLLLPYRRVPIQEDDLDDSLCGLPLKKTLTTQTKQTRLQKLMQINEIYPFQRKNMKLQDELKDQNIFNKAGYIYDQYLSQLPIFQYERNYVEILSIVLMEQLFKIVNRYDEICGYLHSVETRIRPSLKSNERSTNTNIYMKENINLTNIDPIKQMKAPLNFKSMKQEEAHNRKSSEHQEFSSIINNNQKTVVSYINDSAHQTIIPTIKKQYVSIYESKSITAEEVYQISLKYKTLEGLIRNLNKQKHKRLSSNNTSNPSNLQQFRFKQQIEVQQQY